MENSGLFHFSPSRPVVVAYSNLLTLLPGCCSICRRSGYRDCIDNCNPPSLFLSAAPPAFGQRRRASAAAALLTSHIILPWFHVDKLCRVRWRVQRAHEKTELFVNSKQRHGRKENGEGADGFGESLCGRLGGGGRQADEGCVVD